MIKGLPQIAFQLYMDVNEKLRKNAIDAVGFNGVTLDEIADGLPTVNYLIENVLAAGQPAVIAGPKKCMKTGISVDLMLSLAFKKPFLGFFQVVERVNVGLFSGESGLPVIAETVQRIARSKGISLEKINDDDGFVVLDDKLPLLDDQRHLLALEGLILENELKVVIIDPLYLALDVGMASTNIYAMGGKLRDVMDLMRETDCTLILNHHFTKGNAVVKPDLVHMAAAGIQEYVRQWILLGRRKQYYPDKDAGHHELWLNIGGSAGHSSFLALDIDEGPPPAVKFGDDDTESPSTDEADLKENSHPEIGRKWATKVRPASAVKSSALGK